MVEKKDPNEGRTKCEIYSRSVGFIRPVEQWNAGKQAEYADRVDYNKQITNPEIPEKFKKNETKNI